MHSPGTFGTLNFLRAINAERGWCARPHVCWARRRLAGGNGREETLFPRGSMSEVQWELSIAKAKKSLQNVVRYGKIVAGFYAFTGRIMT